MTPHSTFCGQTPLSPLIFKFPFVHAYCSALCRRQLQWLPYRDNPLKPKDRMRPVPTLSWCHYVCRPDSSEDLDDSNVAATIVVVESPDDDVVDQEEALSSESGIFFLPSALRLARRVLGLQNQPILLQWYVDILLFGSYAIGKRPWHIVALWSV
jgi:hypothetical protein